MDEYNNHTIILAHYWDLQAFTSWALALGPVLEIFIMHFTLFTHRVIQLSPHGLTPIS
jgi:hypothetical protein